MEKNIEKLWLKFGTQLKAFIFKHTTDEALTDDLLQEVFIKIHEKIDTLRDDSKLQSWIYQITRNTIVDHFRAIQKDAKIDFEYTIDEEVITDDFMSETLQDMVKMMDSLPAEYCESLCLTELGGMSQKAYAEKKGLSYSGAKSRVQRAKIMLKDMLMNCCHYQFDKYGTVIDVHPIHYCCCSQYITK